MWERESCASLGSLLKLLPKALQERGQTISQSTGGFSEHWRAIPFDHCRGQCSRWIPGRFADLLLCCPGRTRDRWPRGPGLALRRHIRTRQVAHLCGQPRESERWTLVGLLGAYDIAEPAALLMSMGLFSPGRPLYGRDRCGMSIGMVHRASHTTSGARASFLTKSLICSGLCW